MLEFSVATSVYANDKPEYVKVALSSILENQTVKPTEVILVVDGPIPNELDAVLIECEKHFSELVLVRLEKNQGLGNALRIALQYCRYEVVARMDSDDISREDRFFQQLSIMEANPEIDIVGGNISEFIGNKENVVGERIVPTDNTAIREYMKKRCAMNHVTVMFRKSAIEKAGGYQDLFWNEDYYLWIRMLLNGAIFQNTGTTLVDVRIGNEMYKRRGGKKYFDSELYLQKYMLSQKMISRWVFIGNVIKRIIVQLVLPNSIRGWVFRTFARKKA